MVDAQPLVQVQQFLEYYARGVTTDDLSAAVESSLVGSLLVALPVEPRQFTGECNTSYDPTADFQDRCYATTSRRVCVSAHGHAFR